MLKTLQDLFLVLTSVLFIVDPLTAVPTFLAMTARDAPPVRRLMARRGAWTCGVTLTAFALGGSLIFRLFGITIAAFKIAGGVVIGLNALDMVQARRSQQRETPVEKAEGIEKEDVGIMPLGIPMLAGPGAISTVMVLSGAAKTPLTTAAVYVAIGLTAYLCSVTLAAATRIERRLAQTGPRRRHRHVEPGRHAVGPPQPRRLEPFDRLRHDRFRPERVAPRGLGAVQQPVRRADRRLQALRRLQARHHAAAHGERQAGLLRQLLQRVLQLSHRRPGGFGARLREQERELIAAQPGDRVAGPHGAARRPGHEPQHLVAHLVGEEVAHLAKVIEVEIRDRERVRVATRALEFSAGELVEGQPILEPRQVVGAPLCALPARSAHPEIEIASGREDCEDDSDVPDHAEPRHRRGGGATRATRRGGGSLREEWCGPPRWHAVARRSGGRFPRGARTAPRPLRVAGRGSCGGPDRAAGPSRVAEAARHAMRRYVWSRLPCGLLTACVTLHIGCQVPDSAPPTMWSVSYWWDVRCQRTRVRVK